MKIGILGYGNLGKGVECAIKQNADCELVAVFTRRDPSTVKLLTEGVPVVKIDDILSYQDKITLIEDFCQGEMLYLEFNTTPKTNVQSFNQSIP